MFITAFIYVFYFKKFPKLKMPSQNDIEVPLDFLATLCGYTMGTGDLWYYLYLLLTLGWAINALGATSNPICATFSGVQTTVGGATQNEGPASLASSSSRSSSLWWSLCAPLDRDLKIFYSVGASCYALGVVAFSCCCCSCSCCLTLTKILLEFVYFWIFWNTFFSFSRSSLASSAFALYASLLLCFLFSSLPCSTYSLLFFLSLLTQAHLLKSLL